MKKPLLAVLMGVALVACSAASKDASDKSKDKDMGGQAADVASDTDALRAANAAAGEVVRSAGDCDKVKVALPEANRALDEIEQSVRTATGKTTLLAVRKRVNDIAQMCP